MKNEIEVFIINKKTNKFYYKKEVPTKKLS